jgi:hypothetical protein
MASGNSTRLSSQKARRPGDWMAIVLWPLAAVVLGVLDVALTMRMLKGLHLISDATLPELWRVALFLPIPLAGAAAFVARPGSGGRAPGWAASVGIPAVVAGLLAAAVAFLCWKSSYEQMPWWACGLVLLLPAGYGCAACVAMYLSPGHGFWPWGPFLAGSLFWVGAGQAIVIVAIAIAGPGGFDSVFLGVVTGAVGIRALWFGLFRGGQRLVSVGRGEARPPVRKRLEDLLDQG